MKRQIQRQINDPSAYFNQQLPAGSSHVPGLNALAQSYAQSYASPPRAHAVRNGLLGLLFAGPMGGVMGYAASKGAPRRYQQALIDAFPEEVKQILGNQKAADEIAMPRNYADYGQRLIDEGKRQGIIPMNTPDIYQRNLAPMDGGAAPANDIPILSKETLDAARKGSFAGSDINYGADVLSNLAKRVYGDVGGGKGGTLQGGVRQVDQPFFVANPEQILSQLGSVTNNALSEGEKARQFNDPDTAAKRAAEVQRAIAEGDSAKALAIVRKEQAKWLKTTNPYASSGGGGSLSEFEDFSANATPEQKAARRNKFAYGDPDIITPDDVVNELKILKASGASDEEIAAAAREKMIRVGTPRGRGFGAVGGPALAPAGRPDKTKFMGR